MPTAKGSSYLAGCIAGAAFGTWNTNLNAAGKGFRPLTLSPLNPNVEKLADGSYNAQAFERQCPHTGRIYYAFQYSVLLKYEGHQTHLALLLGTAGAPTLQTTGYRHDLGPLVDQTKFGSYMFDDGVSELRFKSTLTIGATVKTTAARFLQGDFRCIASELDTASASGTSSSLTEGANVDYVKMGPASILTYYLQAQGGTETAFTCNGWEWNYDRNFPLDDRVFSNTNAPYMDQPASGRATSTITFNKLRTSTAYLPTMLESGAIQECSLDHTLTTNEKEWTLKLASLKLLNATGNPSDYAAVPEVLTFEVGDDSAGASNYTTFSSVHVDNVNSTNADALATS